MEPHTSMSAGGILPAKAIYPPELIASEVLGSVVDENGIGYSRDIGRSSLFAGHRYYIFGDTFCKDVNGSFVGVQSNTVAVIHDLLDPCKSSYQSIEENGMVDPLIDQAPDEHDENPDIRTALWAFGGIAETSPGIGWIWYEKKTIENGHIIGHAGVGIAKVFVDEYTGALKSHRLPDLLFEEDEPCFGTTSCIVKDDFIYLWGFHKSDTFLARVLKDQPECRELYQFWNGVEYVADIKEAAVVLKEIQQGSIFRTKLFGADRPWVFVGCTKWADSQVMVGAATTLEGPWELFPVYTARPLDDGDEYSYMYCIYPHDWAFDEEYGMLMVTWSEHWPGGVVAAKLTFKMGEMNWRRVSLDNCSWTICQDMMPEKDDTHAVASHCDVKVTLEGGWTRPRMNEPEPFALRVEGPDVDNVEEAAMLLRRLLVKKLAGEAAVSPPLPPPRRRSSLREAFSRFFHKGGSSSANERSSDAE